MQCARRGNEMSHSDENDPMTDRGDKTPTNTSSFSAAPERLQAEASPRDPGGPTPEGFRFQAPARSIQRTETAELKFEEARVAAEDEEHRSSSRGSERLNDWTGYAIVLLVLLAAIPAGSNRPLPWMVWSGVIFLMQAVHLVLLTRLAPGRPLRLVRDRQWLVPVIGLVFCAWLGLQALPLPGFLRGLAAVSFDWGTIEFVSLSFAPSATVMGMIRVLAYISLFSLTLEVSARGTRVDRLGWFLVLGIALHAAWGLVSLRFLGDIALWGEKIAYRDVVTGTFINRNSFATFLGMGMILGLTLVLDRFNVPRVRRACSTAPPRMGLAEQVFLSAGVGVIFLALVGTQSRMGLVAALIGAVLVYGVMRAASGKSRRRAVGEAAALAAVALVFGIAAFGTTFFDRFLFVAGNANDRLTLWAQVFGMIAERPLAGVGWDAFAPAFELFHRAPLTPNYTWELPHSTYLTLWSEAGVVLGSLPLVAAGIVLLRLLSAVRLLRSHYALPVAALGICLQVGLHSLVDFSLEMQANMLLFVVILAMGSAARHTAKAKRGG